MKRIKFVSILLFCVVVVLFIAFVLKDERALLSHPQGLIAKKELEVIATDYFLMMIVVIPTFIFLSIVLWKHLKKKKKKEKAQKEPSKWIQVVLWAFPTAIVLAMTYVTWDSAHKLDPYKPIGDEKPMMIQVVALDWKWLFIYPEQGIATVNFVQFPEKKPIHFALVADGSPMNSFWIPQLSGQIYAMSGMITQLHLMADQIGEYTGRAAEINGEGFADMTFKVKSTSMEEFEKWITSVKDSPLTLTQDAYDALSQRSIKHPIVFYSSVESGLFNKIVMKYMYQEKK